MIRLWFVNLTDFFAESDRLKDLLSATEWERTKRQRIPQRRLEFITARGLLRLLLARELNITAQRVPIDYTPYGKPKLVSAQNEQLQFNMSHSAGCALYALSDDSPVGVDIEQIRSRRSVGSVARRLFTPAEQRFLFCATPDDDATHRFHALWVRKEAYAKAVGTGLSSALGGFEMLQDDETPEGGSPIRSAERSSDSDQTLFAVEQSIRVLRTSGEPTDFVLRDLDIRVKDFSVRFAGAVCCAASVDHLRCDILQPDILQVLR